MAQPIGTQHKHKQTGRAARLPRALLRLRADDPLGLTRAQFDAEKLEQLAASIREHGLLQPIVVSEISLRTIRSTPLRSSF